MSNLDRDKARAAIEPWLIYEARDADRDRILDQLEACVTPTPQTIDRDALITELRGLLEEDYEDFMSPEETTAIAEYQAGRILALVRPTDSITLTRDEAGLAATWASCTVDYLGPHPTPEGEAFARRLEAFGNRKASS